MIPLGDLSRQYLNLKKEIDDAIKDVLKKGRFILGEKLEKFEEEFAGYCGKRFGVGVGNGTDALFLALKSLNIGKGDEVISVANTAIPTISAIVASGAKPVLVDCGEDYLIDVGKIEKNITEKTKAIMPVHLYGQACDMDKILEIAEKHNIEVIEDCAQAHGAEYKGKKVPISEIGCFSFYPSKNLGGIGDGGMIVCDDESIAEKLRLLRNYGQSETYTSIIDGYNSRLDEIQAAILRAKLKYLDGWNEKRRQLALLYNSLLSNVITPKENEWNKHIYHLYVIRHKRRDELISYLKKNNIGVKVHYPVPIHLQPAFSKFRIGNFPNTEKFSNELLSLPLFPELKEDEVMFISNLIKGFTF